MKLYIAGVEEFFALNPSGLEIKVFLALSMFITYGNKISATQTAIGKKIGLAKQNVNEAFKGLLAKHVIYQLAPREYYLNPEYGFMGNDKSRHVLFSRIRDAA